MFIFQNNNNSSAKNVHDAHCFYNLGDKFVKSVKYTVNSYDKRTPVKLKGKVYKTAVRQALLYGAEAWETMRVRRDRIRNEHIRGTRLAESFKRITQKRLKRYGNVMRMKEEHNSEKRGAYSDKNAIGADIPRKTSRGQPNLRWNDATNTAEWRNKINSYTGDPRCWDKPGTKRKLRNLKNVFTIPPQRCLVNHLKATIEAFCSTVYPFK